MDISQANQTRPLYRPGIGPEFEALVMAIADARGWSARHVIEMALIREAKPTEAERAGLVE